MTSGEAQLSELFIAKDDGRSTIKLFIASPTPLEEKNLGTLFAIIEIDSADEINEEIVHLIIDSIEGNYYQSESFEVESAFEHALQKTNQKLQELIGEIGEEWLQHLNVLIGVQKGDELIFANIGRVIALMVYKNSIIDIIDNTAAKIQEINPVKIFSNILSGELRKNSVLFFATESILDYLSREKIKRVLLEYNGDEAIRQFYALLADDTMNTNFAALALRQKEDVLTQPGYAPVGEIQNEIPVINRPHITQPTLDQNPLHRTESPEAHPGTDSMQQLVGQQSRTEELLTSSLLPRLKKTMRENWFKFAQKEAVQEQVQTDTPDPYTDAITDTPEKTTQTIPAAIPPSKTAATTGKHIALQALSITGKVLQKISHLIVQGLTMLWSGFLTLIKKKNRSVHGTTRTNSGANRRSGMSLKMGAFGAGIVRWFGKLSRIQKLFFIIAIVVLLIFAQSVINKGEQKVNKKSEDQYTQQLSDIDTKINEGKAAVLFDNEKARGLFVEARTMLSQIPQDSTAYQGRGKELETSLANQLKRVNNVVTIENPTAVLDYTAINQNIALSRIILLGASVYAFDANTSSAYRGNLESKEVSTTVNENNTNKKVTIAVKASPGTGIVKFADNTFATFDPVTGFNALDLKYTEGKNDIADLAVYGSRLYTVDPKTNNIYKHTQADNEFGVGVGWINDKTPDVNGARSMAIDGNIYVLKDSGKLVRFTASAQDTTFSLAAIDPILQNPTKVYTDENSENLYLLDPQNKRIVVFTKDGKFVAQYQSDTFADTKDMIVDEPNKRAYVLAGAKVYEVPLQDTPQEQK